MKRICIRCGCEKELEKFKSRPYKGHLNYDHTCLECYKKKMRKYYRANKHLWRENREHNPERNKKNLKKYAAKLKMEVLSAYGAKCVCCGETNLRFLTIEHTWHDGKRHRTKTSGAVYCDLRRRGYPKNCGIVVLCWNCNMATRYGAVCPHKRK